MIAKSKRFLFKHKPVGQAPYPKEERFVRFDNNLNTVVLISARNERGGTAYEIKEEVMAHRHHATYGPCADSDADAFEQALKQIRSALQI
jgi:hypothetical protein